MSRRFVTRTKVALTELMGKDLSELHIVALFADGVEVAEHTMVTALGVDDQQQARSGAAPGLDREQDRVPRSVH